MKKIDPENPHGFDETWKPVKLDRDLFCDTSIEIAYCDRSMNDTIDNAFVDALVKCGGHPSEQFTKAIKIALEGGHDGSCMNDDCKCNRCTAFKDEEKLLTRYIAAIGRLAEEHDATGARKIILEQDLEFAKMLYVQHREDTRAVASHDLARARWHELFEDHIKHQVERIECGFVHLGKQIDRIDLTVTGTDSVTVDLSDADWKALKMISKKIDQLIKTILLVFLKKKK